MPRKASGGRKPKPQRPLHIAKHLPSDDEQLYTQCSAGWAAVKADPTHFASPPAAPEMDSALTALGNALKGAPNGGPVERALVREAATKVRNLWGQLVAYAQVALRAIPVEETPPILASVMMYKSNAGTHPPKPPLRAKHGATSGSAVVVALAIVHALTYTWEWSADQTVWSHTITGKTRVTIDGLTPGKVYWFRVRAFLRDGTTTDEVGPVSLMMI